MEETSGAGGPGWEEILTWLVEVGAEGEGDNEGSEGESGRGTARLSWSARVSTNPSSTSTTEEPPHEHRVNTRLDIEKDDIQAVLPISKVSFVSFRAIFKAILTVIRSPIKSCQHRRLMFIANMNFALLKVKCFYE